MNAGGVTRIAVLGLTVACAWLTVDRLRVTSDLTGLFPSTGDAVALGRWTHAFGGRDPAVVLVRGTSVEDVAAVAADVAGAMRHAPSVERVLDRAPDPISTVDPTLAWAYAGPEARARLAALVEPDGMRARLAETRSLLLLPVMEDDARAALARDPLRLAQVPWEGRTELAPGVKALPGDAFTADAGRARLVVAEPRGSAFDSTAANALVADADRAMAAAARSGVTTELAGGHAVAQATEQMLRHDLERSGALSIALAALAFVLTFRRARALAAVLPPLVLGTLWTTGLAALLPGGLDAVAIAFAAVVVGVGVDTGVHVYAAFLDARRTGLLPDAAARSARAVTWRPTLTAAAVAAAAFASLGLGGLHAMRELGLLCGAGELLTAIAIILVTPEIGAWIERGVVPRALDARWTEAIVRVTATRGRAWVVLAACATPIAVVAIAGWPRPADALVAIRPKGLAPLEAGEHIEALFGGGPRQQIVLTADRDLDTARHRADRVAEALEPLAHDGTIEGYDSLSTLAPSDMSVRERLAERDRLDLPARRGALAAALRDAGFDVEACASALEAFAHPSGPPAVAVSPGSPDASLAWFFARHVARDQGGALVATYVRRSDVPASDVGLREAIAAADSASVVTGFDSIDRSLRDELGRDLLLVGGVALVVVAVGMRLALRSVKHALVALATLLCEIAAVGVAMRILGVHWHVYDALVLPVLFGVTVDESMFLLHAATAHSMADALRTQGPLVAATALTTAAGFAALLACRFDGLRDLGAVGALGTLAGLLAALFVVPAALRLLDRGVAGDARPL
jgi:uncharacterized protein